MARAIAIASLRSFVKQLSCDRRTSGLGSENPVIVVLASAHLILTSTAAIRSFSQLVFVVISPLTKRKGSFIPLDCMLNGGE
jgi:hypothetical protein